MAVRDTMAQQVQPYLQPGEQLQAIWFAAAANPAWILISFWIIIANGYRGVAVTDRRILLFKNSAWFPGKIKKPLAEFPRAIRFGQPHGMNWKTEVLGQPIWIHRRFHKDVHLADSLSPLPPAPTS